MRFAEMAEPYIALRWPVFPVARDKRPLTKHGVRDATIDPRVIEDWSQRFPGANIAAATGKISGIMVIDIDGPVGEQSLAALAEQGVIIDSPVQATSGRGRHLYFRDDRTTRNSAGKLGAGIDIRANGGSITLPPSVHQSGRRYEWIGDPYSNTIPHLPLPVLLHIHKPRAMPSTGLAPSISMTEIVARIAGAQPGMRNHELNAAAFLAGKAVRSGHISFDEAEHQLIEAGLGIGLDRHECRATVRSGLQAGQEA